MSLAETPKPALDQYGRCVTCGDHLEGGCCGQCHYVMERLQHDPLFSIQTQTGRIIKASNRRG